jgi:hypothetical protein
MTESVGKWRETDGKEIQSKDASNKNIEGISFSKKSENIRPRISHRRSSYHSCRPRNFLSTSPPIFNLIIVEAFDCHDLDFDSHREKLSSIKLHEGREKRIFQFSILSQTIRGSGFSSFSAA